MPETISRSKKHPLRKLIEMKGLSPLHASRVCGWSPVKSRNFYRILSGEHRVSQATLEQIATGLRLTKEEEERFKLELDEQGLYCTTRSRYERWRAPKPRRDPWIDKSKPAWTPMTEDAKWWLSQLSRPLAPAGRREHAGS